MGRRGLHRRDLMMIMIQEALLLRDPGLNRGLRSMLPELRSKEAAQQRIS